MTSNGATNQPARSSIVALRKAVAASLPDNGHDRYEFVIVAGTADLGIRDFASYLHILDAAYGRTFEGGYRSYAAQPPMHLRISRVRTGSLEIAIDLVRSVASELWQLAVTIVAVRVLPSIVTGEAARNWAEAALRAAEATERWRIARSVPFESIAAAKRLRRSERALIRQVIRSDKLLAQLPDRHARALVDQVERVLIAELDSLPAASRFATEHVREVAIRSVVDRYRS